MSHHYHEDEYADHVDTAMRKRDKIKDDPTPEKVFIIMSIDDGYKTPTSGLGFFTSEAHAKLMLDTLDPLHTDHTIYAFQPHDTTNLESISKLIVKKLAAEGDVNRIQAEINELSQKVRV